MKKIYQQLLLASTVFCLSTSAAQAAVYPTYPVQTLEDGKTYMLANLANPTLYLTRTTWDNALVLGSKETFNGDYGVKVTAHQIEGTNKWSFETSREVVSSGEEGVEDAYLKVTYLGVPAGTNNIRAMQDFGEEVPTFEVTASDVNGFYHITVADGNLETPTIGHMMHLNSGGTYPVANVPGNSWYPDFYGGTVMEEDGVTRKEFYDDNEEIYYVMADSASTKWAFVAIEDADAFVTLGGYWKEVSDFAKSDYCNDGSDYEAGFKLTLAAAEKLLEEGYGAEAVAVIKAKKALYEQIEKANAIAEETSDLDDAISSAMEAFNTLTDAEAVNKATETLKKACDDYEQGLGYVTGLAQNVSFEDLSSQGGNPTNGVAGAPAGWDVYINSAKVSTAAEVSATGMNAWHGVNADCTGYKDGNYGFGLWNNIVPEYELSQTISGLDNGTYIVTCGLMVGANGNGSRRTTQRVFGNLNSALYASEDEYAEGVLPYELKEYAGMTENVTDTDIQEISVRAYVYDGTLTFGIRTNGDVEAALRDSRNGAGGDGWFKCDNFTIYKDGFDSSERQAVFDHMEGVMLKLAEQPMDKNVVESLTNYDSKDLDKGIADMVALMNSVKPEVAAYEKLAAALETADERLTKCEETGYKGTDAFDNAISDIRDGYEAGDYAKEQIDSVITALNTAYDTCVHSGVDEGADVSDMIANRSFEDLSAQGGAGTESGSVMNVPTGWTLKINGVEVQTADEIKAQGINAWCAINNGDNINVEEDGVTYSHQYTDGTHVWGIWNASIPQIELSQKLTGLAPGTYTLTADVMARNTDWSGVNCTTQRIFAQNVVCLYSSDNNYDPTMFEGTTSDDIFRAYTLSQESSLDSEEGYEFLNFAEHDPNYNDILLRTLTLHFGVDESGEATIGFRTDNLDGITGEANTNTAAGWFKLDNFTLYFESSKVPDGIYTGITNTTAQKAQTTGIYDLSGRQVNKAQKGVYIMNGKKVVK